MKNGIGRRWGAALLLSVFLFLFGSSIFPMQQERSGLAAEGRSVRSPYYIPNTTYGSITQMPEKVEIMAHRGDSEKAPENTLRAFSKAIEENIDWIELDVQQSSDGVLMVFHDDSLKRAVGVDGNIWDYPCAQLQTMPIGSRLNEDFDESRIPTFEQALALCKGKIKLNIEIKENDYNRKFPIVEKVIQMIEKYDYLDDCIVTAYTMKMMESIKKANPEVKTAILCDREMDIPYDSPYVDGFSVYTKFISPEVVKEVKKRGKSIYVWTIDTDETLGKVLEAGADHILTNRPALIRKLVNGRQVLAGISKS